MRVLVVHGRYRSVAPSGENNVVDQETRALREAGHHVDSFERRSDDIPGFPAARKAALPARSVWNEQARRDLTRQLVHTRPDVVHVHNTFPLISPSVLRACTDAGTPVVATVHNYKLACASGDFFRDGRPCHDCSGTSGLPGLVHGCYRGSRVATLPVVVGTMANRARWRSEVSAYVFISAAQRDLLGTLGLPRERVFVKHNFVPAPPATATTRRTHSVAYVGRLDQAKGIPLLMAAWDSFRALHPTSGLRLVIAGGGPLEGEVARWGAAHTSVDVVGLVPRARAAQIIAGSLAVIVPSQWEETFGLVAVEAMAAGVAPVAPVSGSFPELVTDGVDGFLFPPGDPQGLTEVMAELDRRPDDAVERGRRGRRTYERRFSEAENVEQLLGIYRFAIANPVSVSASAPVSASTP